MCSRGRSVERGGGDVSEEADRERTVGPRSWANRARLVSELARLWGIGSVEISRVAMTACGLDRRRARDPDHQLEPHDIEALQDAGGIESQGGGEPEANGAGG